jgi:hypothetical protein
VTEPNDADVYQIDMNPVDDIMKEIETAHAERGTTYSREVQLAGVIERLAPIDVNQCIVDNWFCIKDFPSHKFTNISGRTFGIFFDGERILQLFERERVSFNRHDKAGLQGIKNLAGFIVEIDEEGTHDPVVYEQKADLDAAWFDLRVPYIFRCVWNIVKFSGDCASEGVRSIKFLFTKLGSMPKHSA